MRDQEDPMYKLRDPMTKRLILDLTEQHFFGTTHGFMALSETGPVRVKSRRSTQITVFKLCLFTGLIVSASCLH